MKPIIIKARLVDGTWTDERHATGNFVARYIERHGEDAVEFVSGRDRYEARHAPRPVLLMDGTEETCWPHAMKRLNREGRFV